MHNIVGVENRKIAIVVLDIGIRGVLYGTDLNFPNSILEYFYSCVSHSAAVWLNINEFIKFVRPVFRTTYLCCSMAISCAPQVHALQYQELSQLCMNSSNLTR